VATALLLSCGGQQEAPKKQQTLRTITTSKGSFTISGIAFMDGRDLKANPPLTIMKINIWDGVPRNKRVCELDHGTKVELLDAMKDKEEDRYYFRIRKGSCEGWVSEPFLSTEEHSPIGDKM